jgi:hypothetical protein
MTARRDPVQARLLAALALAIAAGGLVLPLPLGLAGILLALWGLWRHGRTGIGVVAMTGACLFTVAGIAIGIAI